MSRAVIFIKRYTPLIILSLSACLLCTGKYSYAVLEGIKLWASYVLPSFLPYLFITTLFSELNETFLIANKLNPLTQKLFKLNGSVGYAFLMSIISGYPMGAKVVSDLTSNGFLSKEEGTRAAILASTSSPAFTIGVVGSCIFHNMFFGILLFVSNIVSAILTAFLFSIKAHPSHHVLSFPNQDKPKSSFYDITYSSVISVLIVGGIIAVFYMASEILVSLGILTPFIKIFGFVFNDEKIGKAFTFGLLEFTRGLKTLGETNFSVLTLPIASFLCGFGGLSALIQSTTYLKKAQIKTTPFFMAKFINAIFGFIVATIFAFFFL